MTEEGNPEPTSDESGGRGSPWLTGIIAALLVVAIAICFYAIGYGVVVLNSPDVSLDPVVIDALERTGYRDVEIQTREEFQGHNQYGCPDRTEKVFNTVAVLASDPNGKVLRVSMCLAGDMPIAAVQSGGNDPSGP